MELPAREKGTSGLTRQDTIPNNGRPRALTETETLEAIRTGAVRSVIVGGCDINGVFRAKRVPAERYAAGGPVEFSDYMWVMDLDEYPQPTPGDYPHWWPSWEGGYADFEAIPDSGTLRILPWLPSTAVVLADYAFVDGRELAIAPRNVLRRVASRAAAQGVVAQFAPEYEFHVFRETEESAAAKGFRDLVALGGRPMAYGAIQGTVDSHLVGSIVDQLEQMRIRVEAWAPEGEAGQYELNLPPKPIVEAADQGFLFKQAVKEISALQGMTASFMAKINPAGYGSSMHTHQSLWSADGEALLHDASDAHNMSAMSRHYVAGQLETLAEFMCLFCPTPNAFKRLVAYSAAGTTTTWGYDNRSASLRFLPRDAGHTRVEQRIPGADANLYIAFAGMLAGGLHGIENELELPDPLEGDAYSQAELPQLPTTLDKAIGLFEESAVAREFLGDEFVDYYAATRRWELDQFNAAVTDYEMRRYLARA
jgi:glutamine synthetase